MSLSRTSTLEVLALVAEAEAEMYDGTTASDEQTWVVYPESSDHGTSFGPFTREGARQFLVLALSSGQRNLHAVNKRALPHWNNV